VAKVGRTVAMVPGVFEVHDETNSPAAAAELRLRNSRRDHVLSGTIPVSSRANFHPSSVWRSRRRLGSCWPPERSF
jgi:hypothetical protein